MDKATLGEILLVDDSAASLKLLSLWLEEAGYLVRQAPSGELAFWSLQTRHPDLILLDVRMPGLDGFETCRRLKADARTQNIPIIFLSAENESADRVQGLQIGGVDFVAKNSCREEFLARVSTHVTLAQVKKALLHERQTLEERVQQRTREIAQSRALLQQVVDSFPDWIYVKDRQHRFLLVNQTMADALQQQPHEMIGKPDRQFFDAIKAFVASNASSEEEETFWQRIHGQEEQAFSGRKVLSEFSEGNARQDEMRFFEIFKGPLFDTEGNINNILCHLRDITEKRSEERARQEFESQFWRAQKMQAIGELTGGIAHDFNNLLATILGFAEFAHNAIGQGRTEKLHYYLSEVLQASQMAKQLVAQLLSFSRNESTSKETLAIAPALREVARMLDATLGSGMMIRLSLAESLPPVALSAIHLYQIIMNLGINARDACRHSGNIDIEADQMALVGKLNCASCHQDFSGAFVRLRIRDDGPGILPEFLGRIFDPFFTTKDVGQGTGLGLSVMHGIVHAAGGHVRVESTVGGGTTFEIYLPIPKEQKPVSPQPEEIRHNHRQLSARLLVVDDESSIVAFVRELFESLGCIVVTSGDPVAALASFQAAPMSFDLVILDQSMPGMSGIELAHQMLALRPDLPVILFSGIGMSIPDSREGQPAIRRFLMKPVSCQDLQNAVLELLQPAQNA